MSCPACGHAWSLHRPHCQAPVGHDVGPCGCGDAPDILLTRLLTLATAVTMVGRQFGDCADELKVQQTPIKATDARTLGGMLEGLRRQLDDAVAAATEGLEKKKGG